MRRSTGSVAAILLLIGSVSTANAGCQECRALTNGTTDWRACARILAHHKKACDGRLEVGRTAHASCISVADARGRECRRQCAECQRGGAIVFSR